MENSLIAVFDFIFSWYGLAIIFIICLFFLVEWNSSPRRPNIKGRGNSRSTNSSYNDSGCDYSSHDCGD